MYIIFLNVLSAIFAFITYLAYFTQVRNNKSKPNPATWFIWLFLSIINSWTYTVINNSLYQTLFLWIITLWILIIFFYSIINGRFSKFSKTEYLSLLLIIIISSYYFISDNVFLTHILIQVIYAISYIPTIIGLFTLKNKEHIYAWILAFITYSISFISLLISKEVNVYKYIHIVFNGLIGNGIIIILTHRINKIRHGKQQ